MKEAIRQSLTTLAVFAGVILLVQLVVHAIDPARPVVPSAGRLPLLIGLAFLFATFSGLRRLQRR